MSKACFIATPPPFDHSKLCTVDGEWSLVGSSNWDTRSFRLNFEFDLEITDRELTAKLDALIDQKIARGKQISPDDVGERAALSQTAQRGGAAIDAVSLERAPK